MRSNLIAVRRGKMGNKYPDFCFGRYPSGYKVSNVPFIDFNRCAEISFLWDQAPYIGIRTAGTSFGTTEVA
jgi:hypothetical protein